MPDSFKKLTVSPAVLSSAGTGSSFLYSNAYWLILWTSRK
nr:MAG TPA: hypothetical protein [Caudoviricetes sp.]